MMVCKNIFLCIEDIRNLTDALVEKSLPKARWTHAAHLAATFELLHRYSPEELAERLPNIIRSYNDVTATPNSDTGGYHQTITLFYIQVINYFMRTLPERVGYLAGCNSLIMGPYGERDYMLGYYSKDRLFSIDARRGWVEPDLKAMNFELGQPQVDISEIEIADDYSLLENAGPEAWQWELMRRDPEFRRSLDKKMPSLKS